MARAGERRFGGAVAEGPEKRRGGGDRDLIGIGKLVQRFLDPPVAEDRVQLAQGHAAANGDVGARPDLQRVAVELGRLDVDQGPQVIRVVDDAFGIGPGLVPGLDNRQVSGGDQEQGIVQPQKQGQAVGRLDQGVEFRFHLALDPFQLAADAVPSRFGDLAQFEQAVGAPPEVLDEGTGLQRRLQALRRADQVPETVVRLQERVVDDGAHVPDGLPGVEPRQVRHHLVRIQGSEIPGKGDGRGNAGPDRRHPGPVVGIEQGGSPRPAVEDEIGRLVLDLEVQIEAGSPGEQLGHVEDRRPGFQRFGLRARVGGNGVAEEPRLPGCVVLQAQNGAFAENDLVGRVGRRFETGDVHVSLFRPLVAVGEGDGQDRIEHGGCLGEDRIGDLFGDPLALDGQVPVEHHHHGLAEGKIAGDQVRIEAECVRLPPSGLESLHDEGPDFLFLPQLFRIHEQAFRGRRRDFRRFRGVVPGGGGRAGGGQPTG